MYLTRRDFLILGGSAVVSTIAFPQNIFAQGIAIPVLMYHDISDDFRDGYTISPSVFASQMQWLYSNGYKTLSVHELESSIDRRGEKAVMITFDDGYASFMDYAFPLLREYGFKATLNIIGKYVGTFIRFRGNRPILSWDEYRLLSKSGFINLGCHTYNLHSLTNNVLTVSEKVIEDDLLLFQQVIKKATGRSTEILAWPYGNYDKKSMNIAKKAGFKYILTSKEGYLRKDSNLLEIPRLNINNKLDLVSFGQYIGEKI